MPQRQLCSRRRHSHRVFQQLSFVKSKIHHSAPSKHLSVVNSNIRLGVHQESKLKTLQWPAWPVNPAPLSCQYGTRHLQPSSLHLPSRPKASHPRPTPQVGSSRLICSARSRTATAVRKAQVSTAREGLAERVAAERAVKATSAAAAAEAEATTTKAVSREVAGSTEEAQAAEELAWLPKPADAAETEMAETARDRAKDRAQGPAEDSREQWVTV